MAALSASLELVEPWRKAGLLCKPYSGNDREDAKRFAAQFPAQLDSIAMEKGTCTAHEVLDGTHEGGAMAPALAGNAAAIRNKTSLMMTRERVVLAQFIKHILNENTAAKYRAFRARAHPFYEAWQDFLVTEAGGNTPQSLEDGIKAKCRAASILGAAGFQLGSIPQFCTWLEVTNNEISDAARRLSEDDLAGILLSALSKCGQPSVADDARKEYNRAPAARLYLQPNAGRGNPGDPPAGARSFSAVRTEFSSQWDSSINDLAIHPRPKGGRQGSAGNSTRVDGHEADVYFDAHAADTSLYEFDPSTGAVTRVSERRVADHHTPDGIAPLSAYEIFLEHDHSVDELRVAFEASLSSAPQGSLAREKICFRCFGIGHTENEDKRAGTKACSSPKRTPPRDINAYLLLVGALAARWSSGNRTRVPTDAMPSPSARGKQPARSASRYPAGGTKPRAGWWRKQGASEAEAEPAEDSAEGAAEEAEAAALVPPLDGPTPVPPRATGRATGSADPFGDSLEEDADWVDPYEAEEVNTVAVAPPRLLLRPINFIIRFVKQWLIMLLWLWTSPAIAVMNSLSGAEALVIAPTHTTSRIYMPRAKHMTLLRPSELAEDARWQASGYTIEYALDAPKYALAGDDTDSMTVDSGATGHCGGRAEDVTEPDAEVPRIKIRVASGALQPVTMTGASTQVVKVRQSGLLETMRLRKYRYSPGLRSRLYSVREGFESDGIQAHFNNENALQLPTGRKVSFLSGGNKYEILARPLKTTRVPSFTEMALEAVDEHTRSMQDHARLGHFSHNRVGSLIGWQSKLHSRECAACMRAGARLHAKRHKQPLQQGKQYKHFGEKVSSDLVVGFPPSIRHGFVAAIVFYDWAKSRIGVGYLKSKEKGAILAAFKQFESDNADLLRDVGGRVLEWHRDNELTSDEIESHLRGETSADADGMAERLATKSTLSVPYDKNTNSGAERAIGILLRPMRVMAAQHDAGGNPYALWPFLMSQAVLVHNALPTKRFDYKTSPDEACGRRVDLSKFHVMFCKCYVNITAMEPNAGGKVGGKLAPTGLASTYLGYDSRRGGHYVFIHQLNRITSTRDVTFPLNEMQFHALPEVWTAHMYFPSDTRQAMGDEYQQRVPLGYKPRAAQAPAAAPPAAPPAVLASPAPALAAPAPGGHGDGGDGGSAEILFRYFQTPNSQPEAFTAKTQAGPIPLPKGEIDALDPNNRWHKKWRAAMLSDLEKKHGNRAWTYVDREEIIRRGFKIHGGRWAFHVKYEDDGVTPKEFRARWVFKGFTERYLTDYEDTFIGTIVGTSQRIMFAEAARRKCTLYECDVRAAFTTATMDRELYFEGPRPFTPKGQCARCDKSVEGSKQAGNLYYKEHSACLTEKLKMERCIADPNLYRKLVGSKFLYIGVLVDNCLILPSDKEMLDWFLTEYKKHYSITGGGPVTKFNGVGIFQDTERGVVSFNLKTYIEQVYRKYITAPARPQMHPLESTTTSHEKFMAMEMPAEPDPAMADKDFDGLVGCLGYIVSQGRPDASFYVAWLQQLSQRPPLAAWHAGITLLCYLYSSRDLSITYGGRSDHLRCSTEPGVDFDALLFNSGLLCWSDASFGSIRSHGGHVIMYMGAAICWVSKRLRVVCISSTEAETAAGVPATKDLRFVLHILDFFGIEIKGAVPLLIDNAGMWFNIRNEGVSARTRYWELWLHFTRQMYQKKMLEPFKVDTTEERADIFTKAMPKANDDYFKFRNDIMNVAK